MGSEIWQGRRAYSKEHPLQRLAVIVGLGVRLEYKFVLLVVVLRKVKNNCSSLEHDKIVAASVDEDGNPAIRIQLDEPRFLLPVGPDIDFLNTGRHVGSADCAPSRHPNTHS